MPDPTPDDRGDLHRLTALARSDPDFDAFARRCAGLLEPPAGPGSADAQARALAGEALAVLGQSPEMARRLEHLSRAPPPERFDGGTLAVPALVAILFLLRTHIRIERHPDGRWACHIEHKPADSKLLTALLQKLAALLPGAGD
jgi:hypothetical protein